MRYVLLTLICLGLMIPLACNTYPTNYGSGNHHYQTATFTPTNLNGWTSTPTPTFQPTPAFVSAFAANAPNGLAYANSLLYVAQGDDASVSQVSVYNSGTNGLTWTWTNYGGINFKAPNGVAANSAGTTVYILDAGDSANNYSGVIYAVAPAATPTPLTSWTTYGNTTFSAPGGIALDTTGNVYVADTDNGKLEEFGPAGVTIASWSAANVYPVAVALDASNNVYVADGNNDQVIVLAPGSGTFTKTTSWYLPFNSSYFSYYGLAVDSSNNVYVADYYNSQVEVYTSTGSQIGVFAGNETGATPLTGPDGLLLFNNNIYVADYDSNNGSNSAGIIEIFGPNNY
jgi:sugar lactone lactonase YvrE